VGEGDLATEKGKTGAPDGTVSAVAPRSSPLSFTVRVLISGGRVGVNVAVTAVGPVIVTVQEPVPGHAGPPTTVQPPNVVPLAGLAVNFTVVPLGNDAVHVDVGGQPMPGGVLATVPLPTVVTERLKGRGRGGPGVGVGVGPGELNVAVTAAGVVASAAR
jgi:hypothetical protein